MYTATVLVCKLGLCGSLFYFYFVRNGDTVGYLAIDLTHVPLERLAIASTRGSLEPLGVTDDSNNLELPTT